MPATFEDAIDIAFVAVIAAFLALGAIALLVTLIGYLDHRSQANAPAPHTAPTPSPTIDDLTVVLVASAVATILEGRGRIRRIRRTNHATGEWAMAGRVTVQGSHIVQGQFLNRGTK